MVSGFLTSPWLHVRMSSAVARPIRSWSKKFTSSTVAAFLRLFWNLYELGTGETAPAVVSTSATDDRGSSSDFFDARGLAAGQVDAELLGGPEDVFLGVL